MSITDSPVSVLSRPSSGEVYRKTIHMLPGLLPFVLAQVPHPRPLDSTSLWVVVVISIALTAVYVLLGRGRPPRG